MKPWDLSPFHKARWGLEHTRKDQTVDSFMKQLISILDQSKCPYVIGRETGEKKKKVHFHLFYEYTHKEDHPEDAINILIRKTFREKKSAYMHKPFTQEEIQNKSSEYYTGYVVKDMNIVASNMDPSHIEMCHNLYKSHTKSTTNDMLNFVKAKYYEQENSYDKELLITCILDYHKHADKIYDFTTIVRREFHLCRLHMFESIERGKARSLTADW